MTTGAQLRVGLAGLGTVGVGVCKLLAKNAQALEKRCGKKLVITAVSARNRYKERGVDLSGVTWYKDPLALATAEEVDVVVEVMGGSGDPAKALVEAALRAKKPVVTANKALLAEHGRALAQLEEETKTALCAEAAVAGGIPILKTLREGLAANTIFELHGILNGTCNYILTEMLETGRDFAEVLQEAQTLGYAEADPSFDIDGVDAAHKLTLLSAMAFGVEVSMRDTFVEGIRKINAVDIAYATELGYRIKLLGIAKRHEDGRIEQRVHPCMVPKHAPIAKVDGVFNGVVIQGDFVDKIVMEGRGAGAGPTASAVVADLVDIARANTSPLFGQPASLLGPLRSLPLGQRSGTFYVRLMVVDRPGVIAEVSAILRDEQVSLEALLQRGRAPGEAVPVVFTTHDTNEAAMQRALQSISRLNSVIEPPQMLRIESF
ncbi:MAG: homoserine dehydrogenase [Myxococcales bacterium]|nr:homoserine dehydrogenase [Myxococcales bacterium]MCB9642640.1 homoserine dehydrogenase [Myxococcales bacterium]